MRAYRFGLLESVILRMPVIAAIAFAISAVAVLVCAVMKKKIKPFVISGIVSAFIFAGTALTVYNLGCGVIRDIIAQMPDLTGFDYEECRTYFLNTFDMTVQERQYSDEYPKGAIIEQIPPAGRDYIIGETTVRCVVSMGVRMVMLPNVCGFDLETARSLFEYCSFNAAVKYEYSDKVSEGHVIRTVPEAGEKLPENSEITVIVSNGSLKDEE